MAGEPHRSGRGVYDPVEGGEDIWQKLSRVVLTLLILVVFSIALTFFLPELDKQKAMNVEIEVLEQRRVAAQKNRDRLRNELRWLSGDPAYIELKARDKLDMYLPGETILRFDDADEIERVGKSQDSEV